MQRRFNRVEGMALDADFHRFLAFGIATLAVLAMVVIAAPAGAGKPGVAGDTTADLALGQTDLAHGILNFGGLSALSGFFSGGPVSAAIDPHGHFYVADVGNNRVLGWEFKVGFTDGAPATIVIGQPDAHSNQCTTTQTGLCFNSPVNCAGLKGGAVTVDGAGDLYVADGCNSRVLEFDTPFSQSTTTGQTAHLVFGQDGSFTSNNSSAPANCGVGDAICTPSGIAADLAGDLYVVDRSSTRVLEYNTPLTKTKLPGSGDTTADRIIGGLGCNQAESAATLCSPTGVAVDSSGNLYLADTGNGRVLEYNSPLVKTSVAGSGDAIADMVFGQNGSFTSNPCSSPSAQCLGAPTSVSIDFAGDLYIADALYNRVLEYNTPLKKNPRVKGSGDNVPDDVFGQGGSFKRQVCSNGLVGTGPPMGTAGVVNPAPSTKGLCDPEGVAADLAGNVYIADSGNGRVLFYDLPLTKVTGVQGAGDTIADLEVGQTSFARNMNNSGGAQALSMPASVVTDSAGHLYVSDGVNNRVLGWKQAAKLASGAPADIVIGQLGFYNYACAVTRGGLCLSHACWSLGSCNSAGAGGLAVDRSGNLYVADTYNNRVMEFDSPFSAASSAGVERLAHLVFGQNGKFTSNGCAAGAPGLCAPSAVAIDSSGNLYVSDSGNSRVLEFDTPLKKTAIAGSSNTLPDLVFGQSDFSGSQCNSSASASATSLCSPQALALDPADNLYVADFGNNRVLEYNTPLAGSGNTTADTVFGQGGDFSASACAGPGPNPSPSPNPAVNPPLTADGLCGPSGVALDSAGDLYISDSRNNRILEYNTPLANQSAPNTTAGTVFGQSGSFTTGTCAGGGILSATGSSPTPDGLCSPQGITVDASGNLWAADNANNRVLEFDQPLP